MIELVRILFLSQVLQAIIPAIIPVTAQSPVLFSDDFEGDLSGWDVYGSNGVYLQDSGDDTHGRVMVLDPNGDVHALVRGSESWRGIRFEGEALFPTTADSYLGFLYNFVIHDDRMDFGNIYLKGNDNYLQVNPHRDYNVSRTLYPEGRSVLRGPDSVVIGQWAHFKIEVRGANGHIYIGNMEIPKITFEALELDSGAVGLQPRSVGGPVWIDNVRVLGISHLGYDGPPIPDFPYSRDSVLTSWDVLGPFGVTLDGAARESGQFTWRSFETDRRGAVVTGRVVDFHGPASVAYFRTRFHSDVAGVGTLHFSTVDDLAIWVNGRFHWFLNRGRQAWPDFWVNSEHVGSRIPINLVQGENEVVIRVRGGIYATGGFFVRFER